MFRFTIRPDEGEEYEVRATSRDVYVWERSGQGRTLQTFMENVSLETCYQLAHIAARRQQMHTGTLAEFAASCDLDFEEEAADGGDGEPDPSRPAP